MSALWHYTCDHGRACIGQSGTLLSGESFANRVVPWPAQYIWLTDLDRPLREALGLTSNYIACDRTAHRYRVVDPADAQPWVVVARGWPRSLRDELETEGARPMHWWVAQEPVAVVYDPIVKAAAS